MRILGFVFSLILFCSIPAFGHNTYFLPGDAFFPTELSAEELAKLNKDDPTQFIFVYHNYDNGGYFCGSIGYPQVKFETLDKKFVEHLIEGYKLIRSYEPKKYVEAQENGKVILKECNPIRVLFYPAEFEYPKYELGLKYNESWVDEGVKHGLKSKDVLLSELIDEKTAIIESWRRAKEVGVFQLKLHDPKEHPFGDLNRGNPITIKGPVKAIILRASPLQEFVSGRLRSDVRIVEQDGVYMYEEGEDSKELVKVKAR